MKMVALKRNESLFQVNLCFWGNKCGWYNSSMIPVKLLIGYDNKEGCKSCSVVEAIVDEIKKRPNVKRITLAGPVDLFDCEFIASKTDENGLSYHAGTFSIPVCRVCKGAEPKEKAVKVNELNQLGSLFNRYEVLI